MQHRYNPEVHKLMAAQWPHLFSFPVPLKIGIHLDFPPNDQLPVPRKKLRRFIAKWVSTPEYQSALQTHRVRYGLDGSMHPMHPGGSEP